jgi:hypothetical protein
MKPLFAKQSAREQLAELSCPERNPEIQHLPKHFPGEVGRDPTSFTPLLTTYNLQLNFVFPCLPYVADRLRFALCALRLFLCRSAFFIFYLTSLVVIGKMYSS